MVFIKERKMLSAKVGKDGVDEQGVQISVGTQTAGPWGGDQFWGGSMECPYLEVNVRFLLGAEDKVKDIAKKIEDLLLKEKIILSE